MIDLLKDGDTTSLHLLIEGTNLIGQERVVGMIKILLRTNEK